jgi:hypothetical protein
MDNRFTAKITMRLAALLGSRGDSSVERRGAHEAGADRTKAPVAVGHRVGPVPGELCSSLTLIAFSSS